jgi:hypothetical protein
VNECVTGLEVGVANWKSAGIKMTLLTQSLLKLMCRLLTLKNDFQEEKFCNFHLHMRGKEEDEVGIQTESLLDPELKNLACLASGGLRFCISSAQLKSLEYFDQNGLAKKH